MAESDLDFAIDEINREQDRWNYIEAQLEASNSRVKELEAALEEIRDLARTGLAPGRWGFNASSSEWDRHKVNRIAGMANEALNKDKEV